MKMEELRREGELRVGEVMMWLNKYLKDDLSRPPRNK